MQNTGQVETTKRLIHVYIARVSDEDFDYLLTLSGSRRELLPNIVRALEADGEEVMVVASDDEPVDVLSPHQADVQVAA